jgi:hypothetical protein
MSITGKLRRWFSVQSEELSAELEAIDIYVEDLEKEKEQIQQKADQLESLVEEILSWWDIDFEEIWNEAK